MVTEAPACRAMLNEATRLWPNRNKASDGILPSAAHTIQNPKSDHERGLAVDVTHDPANGCDVGVWADQICERRDPRVRYVIFNRRIWNPTYSTQWRSYSGTNPHTSHMHISIRSDQRDNTSSWWIPVLPDIRPPSGGSFSDWWFDMPIFKDQADAERAFIRDCYLRYLGRQIESFEAQEWYRLVLAERGADGVIAQIADSGEAQAFRAAMDATIGMQR